MLEEMPVLTKKGQVTVPKALREKLGIKEGDEVIFELEGDMVKIKKVERRSLLSLGGIARGRAIGAGNERDYTKKVVSKRVAEEGLKGE